MTGAPDQQADVSDVSDVKKQLREALERKRKQESSHENPHDSQSKVKGRSASAGRSTFHRRKTG